MSAGEGRAGSCASRPGGHHHWGGAVQDDVRASGGQGGAALPAACTDGAADCPKALPADRRLRGPEGHSHHAIHPCSLPAGTALSVSLMLADKVVIHVEGFLKRVGQTQHF